MVPPVAVAKVGGAVVARAKIPEPHVVAAHIAPNILSALGRSSRHALHSNQPFAGWPPAITGATEINGVGRPLQNIQSRATETASLDIPSSSANHGETSPTNDRLNGPPNSHL